MRMTLNSPLLSDQKIEIIHSVPDLVDWVGVYYQETLLRVSPVFKGDPTPVAIGSVLLVDLARDISYLKTNYTNGRLAIGNIDTIASHILSQFGEATFKQLNSMVGSPMGTTGSRLLAQQLTKVLRVNKLNQSHRIEQDKSRIRLDGRHLLLKVEPSTSFVNLPDMALWLGTKYTQLEAGLSKHGFAK
jgi:hypothetical protein